MCAPVWTGMLQAWGMPGTPTLSSLARVNFPCALREDTVTPTLHLCAPIVHSCFDRVIQYLHTWSTAHRAHTEQKSMHQPLRNAAVTLQTQSQSDAWRFSVNRFMKVSSVTVLRLLMLAQGAKSMCIHWRHARQRVMVSQDLANRAFLFPPFLGSKGGVCEEETEAERGLCAARRPPGVHVYITAPRGGALRSRNR